MKPTVKARVLGGGLLLLIMAGGSMGCQKAATSSPIAAASATPDARVRADGSRAEGVEDLRNRQESLIVELDRAITQDPKNGALYLQRGQAHFLLGDRILPDTDPKEKAQDDLRHLQSALTDFDKAAQLMPTDAQAYEHRGRAFRALHKRVLMPFYDSEIFRRTAEGGKDDSYYINSAIADFSKAIELKPDFAPAYLGRARALPEIGKQQEALADVDRAIELKPDYAEAYLVRGNFRRDSGQAPESGKGSALEDYSQAIRWDPDSPEAYAQRGNLLLNATPVGKRQPALDDLRKAVALYRQQGNPQPWLEDSLAQFETMELRHK